MKQRRKFYLQAGFTLIELLVVVAILVAVATIGSGALFSALQTSREQLVEPEMVRIASAIKLFKQDTGYYPKQGPFDLDTAAPAGAISLASLPVEAGLTDPERTRWFYSPANFYQLTRNASPLATTGHVLEDWSPDTGRGWRGPYLKGFSDGFVDIRAGINDGTAAGNPGGNPLAGDDIPDVIGIADPFQFLPEAVGAGTLLDWAEIPRLPGPRDFEKETWGRPYLLFGLDTQPWLVSMGADGAYGPGGDDVVLDIE